MAGPRNIALCFDGTWNSDDALSPTNVVKTHKAIRPATSAGTRQIAYYDRGVGTGRFDRFRGGVLGLGLARNVELAYRWLYTSPTSFPSRPSRVCSGRQERLVSGRNMQRESGGETSSSPSRFRPE